MAAAGASAVVNAYVADVVAADDTAAALPSFSFSLFWFVLVAVVIGFSSGIVHSEDPEVIR